MEREQKTVIVTGASQGIGAGVVRAFLARGYNVVGTSRSATKLKEPASAHLALVDGDIGQLETAQHVADAALRKFGSCYRCEPMQIGSPTRARTWDLRINSPSLYQLS